MNKFDINKFNELYEFGNIGAIKYLHNNLIYVDDFDNNFVLHDLYNSICYLHRYIVIRESEMINCEKLYEIYSELEELFFNELGIVFDFDTSLYVIKEK
jgi:hypothetical protein